MDERLAAIGFLERQAAVDRAEIARALIDEREDQYAPHEVRADDEEILAIARRAAAVVFVEEDEGQLGLAAEVSPERLDDALAACANSVRANFKAAKDKKSGKS